ncbi:hypothetical protein M3Y99_01765500 [Aphelenchoides fujianensis]|nr:hypothetical protein M3Y99_01765500 [Aphelenchoides fujianensis]
MDFATPYNIVRHANDAFYENLQSKKWSDRQEAIKQLGRDIMDKNPRLTNDDVSGIHSLVSELLKATTRTSTLRRSRRRRWPVLARGLGGGFRPFAPDALSTALLRLKEAKPLVRDPCIECLDAAYATTTFDAALPCIKEGLANKAPAAKVQTCDFFTRIMRKIDLKTAKKHAAATKELALGSDANCREAAMKSLAAFLHAVGRQAGMPLIQTVADDKLKMAKVDEYFEQFANEVPKEETTTTTAEVPAELPKSEEARRFLTPYDLLKHTKDEFYH